MSSKVELYRYDLTNGMASQYAPILIGRALEGIWHTSIVVFGKEYYFDGGVGIVSGLPGQTRFGLPKRSEVLGFTTRTMDSFEKWNQDKVEANYFGPESYILMERNCNHYSQEACRFLLEKDIPDDVRLMIPTLLATPLGQMIGPMLQQMVTGLPGTNGGIAATPFGAFLGGANPSQGMFGGNPSMGGFGAGQTSNATSSATAAHLDAETQESLDIYLALIASEEVSNEQKIATLEALERILNNIFVQPTNLHYQRLSKSSEFYKSKISPFQVAADLLLLAGFEPDGDTHLMFKGSSAKLEVFIKAIQKAKTTIV